MSLTFPNESKLAALAATFRSVKFFCHLTEANFAFLTFFAKFAQRKVPKNENYPPTLVSHSCSCYAAAAR